ncbi:MAG: hypothetical protein QHH80_14690 [Anaerolineae bacterium]|nr:hypothetical protein [Anaerolineae bacterium]
MTDAEWEVYRKSHPYDDIVEAEQGKIACDRARYARRRTEGNALVRRGLRALVAGAQPVADEDENTSLADRELVAERTRRNVRTRKRRLRSLRKRSED